MRQEEEEQEEEQEEEEEESRQQARRFQVSRHMPSVAHLRIAGLMAVLLGAFAIATPAQADPFDIKTFTSGTTDVAGTPYTVAGGHPDKNATGFTVTLRTGDGVPEGNLNGTYVKLPPGVIGNPSSALRCTIGRVHTDGLGNNNSDCPQAAMVGIAKPTIAPLTEPVQLTRPLYSLIPERGYPAQFAFPVYLGEFVVVSVFPQSRDDDYRLTLATPNIPSVRASGFEAIFCGNGVEGDGINYNPFGPPDIPKPLKCKPPTGVGQVPFLSNPVDCSQTSNYELAIDNVEHAGDLLFPGVPDLADPDWKTELFTDFPVIGCNDPDLANQFKPTVATKPVQNGGPVQADQPTGLSVELKFPQSNDPTDLSTEFDSGVPQAPPPKDITVKFPAGVAISPASADGLGACSDQASDPAGDQVHYGDTVPVTCPDASKIGTAVARSPLVATHDPITDEVNGAEALIGDVFLLKPHAGDIVKGQDSKVRLLIQIDNRRYGVNFKLPGVATIDKATGQITSVFSANPQLASSSLTVDLKSGPRAPLMTPVTCGKFASTTTIVPWSTPGTPDAHPGASFDVGSGPNGSGCPASSATRPFAPALSAGSDSSKAGAVSSFTLKLSRADGDQELSSVSVTTPPGFTAKLAGVPSCSDASISAAEGKSGAAEKAAPSCPASTRLGSVIAGAGPGPSPYYTPGDVYLAGPYKGAPLSFAFITPVIAGPFDLGNVVVRAGVYLDIATTAVTVKTDPLPQILDGFPLRLRSLTTRLDRSDFTRNPTDCQQMSVSATALSTEGATAGPTTPFQVGSCKDLGFKPDLKLALKGKVSRRSHPTLTASLVARPGDANIAAAQVKLPKAAFLDNAHIGQVCTRPQFAAHECPEGSIYGTATATTPLLDYPLSGNVYLRSSSNKLPDLVAGFQGPSSQPIEIELSGKTDSVKGALRNTFEAVPDVPVSTFSLTLFGGKKGLIIMSSGFCGNPRADIQFDGQNGMEYDTTPKVKAKCPKKKGKKGKKSSK
jgi:hypothetical protein